MERRKLFVLEVSYFYYSLSSFLSLTLTQGRLVSADEDYTIIPPCVRRKKALIDR